MTWQPAVHEVGPCGHHFCRGHDACRYIEGTLTVAESSEDGAA